MAVVHYQIYVKGSLPSEWAQAFHPMTIQNHPDGNASLSGPVVDQATLHGLLARIRDLGLELVSLNPVPYPEIEKERKNGHLNLDHLPGRPPQPGDSAPPLHSPTDPLHRAPAQRFA